MCFQLLLGPLSEIPKRNNEETEETIIGSLPLLFSFPALPLAPGMGAAAGLQRLTRLSLPDGPLPLDEHPPAAPERPPPSPLP